MEHGREITEQDIEKDWSYYKSMIEENDGRQYIEILHELSLDFINNYEFRTMHDNKSMWVFTNPVYRRKGEELIKEEITRNLGMYLRQKHINEVVSKIKNMTVHERHELEREKRYIPLKNGWYDLENDELVDPQPDVFLTNEIPVEYDEDADCEKIIDFIHDVVEDENVPLIQEMIGYTLYKAYPIAKAFMLLGSGENGKSTFLEMLEEFIGRQNVANPSLYELLYNKFAKADLHGKLANIHADLSSGELKKTGNFKMLTGGDYIRAEEKYQDGFEFINHAKLIYSANELPKTFDDTDAFWRRWIPIKFPYKFTSNPDDGHKDKDPEIIDKITTDEQLSGLFNWAVEGLQRVLRNGEFSTTDSTERMLAGWQAQSNPLNTFIENCVEVDKQSYVTKDDFHSAYTAFCNDMDAEPMSKQKVGRKVPTMIPETETTRPKIGDKRKTAWDNITLTDEFSDFDRHSGGNSQKQLDNTGSDEGDVNPRQGNVNPGVTQNSSESVENQTKQGSESHVKDVKGNRNTSDHSAGGREVNSSKRVDNPDMNTVPNETEVLNAVDELDDGDGVEYTELLDLIDAPSDETESVINDLLGDGVLYEPKPGRVKQL